MGIVPHAYKGAFHLPSLAWSFIELYIIVNKLGIKVPAVNICQVYRVVEEMNTEAPIHKNKELECGLVLVVFNDCEFDVHHVVLVAML